MPATGTGSIAPMSLQEIKDAMEVLGDAAEEAGKPTWAAAIRRLAQGGGAPLGAYDILKRAGFDPNRGPTERRRGGRTLWMIAEAVALASRGVDIELTGHSPHCSLDLAQQAADLARRAGMEQVAERLFYEGRMRRWAPERIEFVDHFARDRRG